MKRIELLKKMKFSEEIKSKIKKTLSKYPEVESAILPCLFIVQNEYGYLSMEVIEELSREIDVQPDYIYSTATFYTMFNLKKIGKYHVQVCRNISCALLGSKSLVEYISEKLSIKVGETTGDGKFTLSEVECLGSCGTAPVMMINDKYYENLSKLKVDKILKDCK